LTYGQAGHLIYLAWGAAQLTAIGTRIMRITPLLISRSLPILAFLIPLQAQAGQPAQSWYGEQGYVAPSGVRIVACHGYGCSRRTALAVDMSILSRAGSLLRSGQGSPETERTALREIVRSYTAYLAREVGGKTDLPGSPPEMSGVHGQMDCLDETANTTSLLLVLEAQGLLAHHQVERPQTRGFFFDGRYPHTTAIIAEKRTGREWAVDPWRKAPGQRPDILPLAVWRQDS
jgi:hypothetical protein